MYTYVTNPHTQISKLLITHFVTQIQQYLDTIT